MTRIRPGWACHDTRARPHAGVEALVRADCDSDQRLKHPHGLRVRVPETRDLFTRHWQTILHNTLFRTHTPLL